MIDLLTELGLNPASFIMVLMVVIALTVAFYSRFFINLFDPLLFFVISTIASTALVFALPWEASLKVEYGFFCVFFWIGFAIRGRSPKTAHSIPKDPGSLLSLEVLLLLLFVVFFVCNFYIGLTVGFPLFSSDPSIAKVTSYTGGLGFVRRVNAYPFTFFASGCILLATIGYKRLQFMLLLGAACLLEIVSGSKSALMPLIFILGFIISHPALVKGNSKLVSRMRKYALFSFMAATFVAILVLVIDTGGINSALQALAKRLLFYGDVIFYYFPTRGANPALVALKPFDYLSYLFQPILGALRLGEVPAALGSVIMGTDDAGFGPNPQYFVRADIFFGPVIGCVYCLLCGLLISWLRRRFYNHSSISPTSFVFRLVLAVVAFDIATDSGMFVGAVVDLVLIVGPLWLLTWLLIEASNSVGFKVHQTPDACSHH